MRISSAFDGGNIVCLNDSHLSDIQLEIRPDNNSHYFQWFYYRLVGAKGEACTMNILNAAKSGYPGGWEGYRAVASYDRQHWFRVATRYLNGVLTISHTPESDSVYYAYFAPYSMERHADLVAKTLEHPLAELIVLGQTLDGQNIDLIRIGEPGAGKKVCWIIARQHPGETMAQWCMEGFLDRLLYSEDQEAMRLRDEAVFYVVPNMNPDGSRRGHLRTNAAGTDLNREWQEPSLDKSPEVYHVLQKMKDTRPDFCLDMHGDEVIPNNFIAGAEGIPDWTNRLADQLESFKDAFKAATPEFQTEEGYPVDAPGQANMKVGANAMAQYFDCLAMTLEMPFKDTRETADEIEGWSPKRSAQLGQDVITAMAAVWDKLGKA
ncbi:M14 family metallopeptidase [Woodsholea maritima]|uniref:M14 family metallopeptidase n=1 Tax=Woodsholea maritima TaxID=240237 RepID=UPI00035F845B|nr:M14-type cytosolic carboxypeptidase [Woodsholea maritima]